MNDRIEILGEELIERFPELTCEVLAGSARLGIPLGWHYVLDLVWILSRLEIAVPARILDAGAGYGLLQFLLADRGFDVVSADVLARRTRADLERLYRFEHLGTGRGIDHGYLRHHALAGGNALRRGVGALLDLRLRDLSRHLAGRLRGGKTGRGAENDRPRVVFYHCDLERMAALDDASVDAAVSVSALEHNEPAKAKAVAREVERVVRPGGQILHTVSAVSDNVGSNQEESGGAFHPPSYSWLLDEAGLCEVYGLEAPASNFDRREELRSALRDSRFLRRWLSLFYYESDRNGMPWGVWDPQYLPVGVAKTNRPHPQRP